MHELSIAQSILEIVREHVPESSLAEVQSIKIRLGKWSGVLAESLDFSFSALTNDTTLSQAHLCIERVETRLECGNCGEISILDDMLFLCPKCLSPDVKLIAGSELQVVEIEMAEEKGESHEHHHH
ncbi:MAG: hydrogenase maturation nickel metallochaperone HypA [Terriglobia bacterium]